jgi:hypothetical protein
MGLLPELVTEKKIRQQAGQGEQVFVNTSGSG